jgi:hypothetical protein
MEVKYRYTRAELEGGKLALAIARMLGVRPKLVKTELTPSEARELGLANGEPQFEFPPGLSNGD